MKEYVGYISKSKKAQEHDGDVVLLWQKTLIHFQKCSFIIHYNDLLIIMNNKRTFLKMN